MGRPVGGPVTDPDQGDGGWAMAQASLGERWWDGGCVLKKAQPTGFPGGCGAREMAAGDGR